MRKLFFLLFFLSFSFSFSELKKQTICLNMIVKDEKKVIERCLKSVLPIIDYWVIVDTGSTDGTQTVIKNFMKDVPGELHEKPWKNFAYNRNHALSLAKDKADYILFIDADEELIFEQDFKLPFLTKDFYYMNCHFVGRSYVRNQLIRSKLDWKWEGVVHEVIKCPKVYSYGRLEKVYNFIRPGEGARSQDGQKYMRDAQALEEVLKKDPNNKRDIFYLAQSYNAGGKLELAEKNYKKRVSLGGWDQEIFWSKYCIALLQKSQKKDPEVYLKSFMEAYNYKPARAEPLYYLVNHYRLNDELEKAFLLANLALKLSYPDDILFVEKWIYDYGLLLERSVAAYWLGKYDVALQDSIKLLEIDNLPGHIKKRVLKNMKFIHKKLTTKINSFQTKIPLDQGEL